MALAIAVSVLSIAQEDPFVPTQAAMKYSPNVGSDTPERVFFGDTQLDTAFSTDAGLVGAILTPADSYRFAKE
ncbi:MAG: DUF3604 domain-containing protein [Gammaproteobacteria bacterium]